MHKVHHHRHKEMEHHKERARHKAAHNAEKAREYSLHPGMVDNRMVKEDHQEGIARVVQRKGAMEVGQHGKMTAHGDVAHWNRSQTKLTPRQG
jgi:hypothetical protein